MFTNRTFETGLIGATLGGLTTPSFSALILGAIIAIASMTLYHKVR